MRLLHRQAQLDVTDRENMLLIILTLLQSENGPVARKTKAQFYDSPNEVIRDG